MKKWTELYSPQELILHDDDRYIIVNKPAGVPSQPDKTGDTSLSEWLTSHQGTSPHILSRIDRPVSGAMIFSKKGGQQHRDIKKTYLAITTPPEKSEDTLEHYLQKDGRHHKSRIVTKEQGKLSKLTYHVIQELNKYVVLEIQLETGRFHQIRVQLSHIGCPIKGDVKYGARRGNRDRSIDLHAYKVELPYLEAPILAPILHKEGVWLHVDLVKGSRTS